MFAFAAKRLLLALPLLLVVSFLCFSLPDVLLRDLVASSRDSM